MRRSRRGHRGDMGATSRDGPVKGVSRPSSRRCLARARHAAAIRASARADARGHVSLAADRFLDLPAAGIGQVALRRITHPPSPQDATPGEDGGNSAIPSASSTSSTLFPDPAAPRPLRVVPGAPRNHLWKPPHLTKPEALQCAALSRSLGTRRVRPDPPFSALRSPSNNVPQ